MFEIIPAPGTEDTEWTTIEKKIEAVKSFAKTIHIDIVDGKFAPNTTFSDPEPFKKYTSDILFEVHLMVEEPIHYLKPWAAAGFKRFIGHIEKMSDQMAFVAEAEQLGEVGLAIDGPTRMDTLAVSPLDLDTILIMTINAGASGQAFQEEQLEKVKLLAEDALLPIAVDGGINEKTLEVAFNAGARRFGVTSALYKEGDPAENYKKLNQMCEQLFLKQL